MCGNDLQQTISLFSFSISKMKEKRNLPSKFILTRCFSFKINSQYSKAIFKIISPIISQRNIIKDWWSMLCENTRKSTYFIRREKFCYYGSFCNMLGVIQFNKSAANKTGNFSATAKHEFYEYLNTTTFCIGETFIYQMSSWVQVCLLTEKFLESTFHTAAGKFSLWT